MDSNFPPVDYSGLPGLRFDSQGMLLPHSILGNLQDFRGYLEAKGETELVKRIPESVTEPLSENEGRLRSAGTEKPPEQRNRETNALHHWDTHMRHRRRQQDVLSDLLNRPVENLLMNQDDRCRETREERELLDRTLPLIQSGYGYRVGSEFWSLPQHYGDELSGITATLTQAELGRRKPVTHVGLPNSMRQETGLKCGEASRPFSQTRAQRSYLQQQIEELREVLCDHDIEKPDMSRLEVLGSGKPPTYDAVCQSPSTVMEEKEKELTESKNEFLDPLTEEADLQSLGGPALRFCGQLATWTGNSVINQGEMGISGTVMFETLTGEVATSYVELQNEGSTVIFFSWQEVPVKHGFSWLPSRKKKQHFYFDSLPGWISPGDTRRVELTFRSEEPGIKTELWQLNTHPLLLRGASMQLTLRGVALHQDQTADQRLFLETKLEKLVVLRTCQSIVDEVLQGVRSPERPSSPADLYITEEQVFVGKNPKLQFLHQPVHNLKRLWEEVAEGHTWDLSVDTLRQAVLSLPDEEPSDNVTTREQSLATLNSLLLQLSESSDVRRQRPTAVTAGQQLMRTLLDSVSDEAAQLRVLLGLPQSDTWTGTNDESVTSDADLADNINRDEESKKIKESTAGERSGARSRFKDDNKRESKSVTTEKSVEERKHGRSREDLRKNSREKQGKESGSLVDVRSESSLEPPADEQQVSSETKLLYTRLLHTKIYSLMEDFVDNLCDLMDECDPVDEQETHKHLKTLS